MSLLNKYLKKIYKENYIGVEEEEEETYDLKKIFGYRDPEELLEKEIEYEDFIIWIERNRDRHNEGFNWQIYNVYNNNGILHSGMTFDIEDALKQAIDYVSG